MALYPCDVHGGRYTGPQRSLYLTVANGANSERAKYRMCAQCFGGALHDVSNLIEALETADEDARCYICSTSPAEAAIFASFYQPGREAECFFGRGCAEHGRLPTLQAKLGLSGGR